MKRGLGTCRVSSSLAMISKKTRTDGLTGNLTGTSLVSGKSSPRVSFALKVCRPGAASRRRGDFFFLFFQRFDVGAIGFGFASHWLKNWRDSFKPITKCSTRNHVITFDSHLKLSFLCISLPFPSFAGRELTCFAFIWTT